MQEVFTEKVTTQLPKNSNLVNYSVLRDFYSPSPFRSFSIKYVVNGTELYCVNGVKHHVKSQEYLLANKFSEGYVKVESKQAVKGICIDVAPHILSEAVASHLQPDTAQSDLDLDKFFDSKTFLENKYQVNNTSLGSLLKEVEVGIQNDPSYDLNFSKEFYFLISEKIVRDHVPLVKQLQGIKAIKAETKKDLFRKLSKAKELIDQCFLTPLSVAEVALYAGFSEFHFYRLYRSVFGITPHQYILKKRLGYARKILETERMSVGEVAVLSGLTDIHNFSKVFKKYFGFPPSSLLI